jgi:hypothetical protein
LNIGLARLVEKIKFIHPEIRVVAFHVGIVARVARLGGFKRQEISAKGAFIGSAIRPKGATRFPILAEACVVRDRVLDDESLRPFWVCQYHAKANRAAIVLHIKRVLRHPERFGEVIHNLGDVIEGIREFFRVRPVAVSKAWVIGRDKVMAIRKPSEERLEHPRRRREAVQQENRRRIFRAGLPVENGKPINLDIATKSRVFHGTFLSLHLV